jgi:dTDP-4-dehydrorhamnose 3,5-epimerase
MKVTETPLKNLLVIEPRIFPDARGFFYESYQHQRYHEHGIPELVQDNVSRSCKNTLRGLHYQLPNSQGKLVSVIRGSVWDVAVDIRKSSPTFGQWFGVVLDEDNHKQLYVPPGFAHGFCVLSEEVDFLYKCSDYYHPEHEHGIMWNDPEININWPINNPILSDKDKRFTKLSEISDEHLFT